jgi:hypothetical protein
VAHRPTLKILSLMGHFFAPTKFMMTGFFM